MLVLEKSIIKKTTKNEYCIVHILKDGKKVRRVSDCEHFENREAAKKEMVDKEKDMQESIKQGIFV